MSDAAQAEHGSPQKPGNAAWKRTERRLRALVRSGQADSTGGQQHASTGQFNAVRYFAIDAVSTVDTHRGQGVSR